jgi:predicted flap endonuclease-1-like 5' DNA nuclease
MSAYYRLVLTSVCRSNHHRLAVMALEALQQPRASDWRDVFLKHQAAYLEGAKAPDNVFRDFKNHVCHVAEDNWGGAPQAAREWYRRTVRALSAGDWRHAAYCAGVMSHYVVDPVQPFHTGQSEAEGVVHRALEWSLSCAFRELSALMAEAEAPEIGMPEGELWLEELVIAGARFAHQHYDALLDHYDVAAGSRRPVDGLDQELKDIAARLLAYAAALLARVLDRAIAESKAEPPRVSLTLDTVFAVLSQPIHLALKAIDNAAERRIVAAQYEEFRKTGKVRETLSEDDRIVRALHAQEVLGVSLSSLDCEWPRETGVLHGQGAAPRKPAPARKSQPPRAVATDDVPQAPLQAPPVAEHVEMLELSEQPAEAQDPPEADDGAEDDAAARSQRLRLTPDDDVVDAPSIGPKTAGRLSILGVKTVGDLLALSPQEAAKRIKASHINAQVIRDWQAQALLACTVPDLSAGAAQLLVGAGVYTADDLADADAEFLLEAIQEFADTHDGQRALRGAEPPGLDEIEDWIAAARSVFEGRDAA